MAKKKPDDIDKLVQELTKNATAEELLKDSGLLKELKKRLVEVALEAEMTEHLGYEKHSPEGHGTGNSRNGKTSKRIIGADGDVEIEVPRDRNGDFEPQLIRKRQVRLPGFDEKVLSLYARGMTTREIQGHLHEIYDVEVSPALISRVTDAVLDEVKAWQNRPLDAVWPVVYLDAIHLKIRTDGRVQNRAVYVALGINLTGNGVIDINNFQQNSGYSSYVGFSRRRYRVSTDSRCGCGIGNYRGFFSHQGEVDRFALASFESAQFPDDLVTEDGASFACRDQCCACR